LNYSKLMLRTILASVAGTALLLGAACGDDDGGEPGDTPTAEAAAATATTAPEVSTTAEATPADAPTTAPAEPAELSQEFRDFAPQIDEALRNKDIEFFAQHAWTEQVTCTAEDVAITGFFAACEEEGAEFQGMGLSVWKAEGGGLVQAERVLALIDSLWSLQAPEGEDAFGGPEATLYALGANAREGYAAQVAVITSLINRPAGMQGTGPLRVVLVLHWRFEEDDRRLFEVMQAVQLAEDLLEPTEDGRTYVAAWERFGQ
jgi:hypothetical protein